MNFSYTHEQHVIRDTVKRLVAQKFVPLIASQDPDRVMSRGTFLSVLKAVAPMGLTAPRLPASEGGAGIGMLDYGIVFEQIPPQIGINLLAHEGSIARLYAECTAEQRGRLLPDLIAGMRIACTGSSEPDTGSDPRGIKTKLVEEGGVLKLYGRKMWITNASICDVMIVTCLDRRSGKDKGGVIKVVVERDVSPFETRAIETIGLRQGYLGEAVFEGCEVPVQNVIDTPARGTEILKNSWIVNRPLIGLQAVFLAQEALNKAIDYAKTRVAFGKPIAAHQLVQKNLSDMATAITASRLLCYNALALVDVGTPSEGASAMAKRFAQNSCERVIWEAMNVFGALGLARETGLEHMYRDARMLSVPDGTNELLALIHGRELTGMEAFRGG